MTMVDEEYIPPTLEEYALSLIDLGNFLRSHPKLFETKHYSGAYRPEPPDEELNINVLCKDAEDLAYHVRQLGGGEKYSDVSEYWSYTGVRRRFGMHTIDVYCVSSEVCTPKRRETKSVPVVELTEEAKAAIEEIRTEHTRYETREIVTEWDCPPSLLNASTAVEETVSEESF
jgi:hypothetical protein